jgi:hypothetical protein
MGWNRKCIQGFGGEPKVMKPIGRLYRDRRMILKWILKNWSRRV